MGKIAGARRIEEAAEREARRADAQRRRRAILRLVAFVLPVSFLVGVSIEMAKWAWGSPVVVAWLGVAMVSLLLLVWGICTIR